MHFCRPPVLPAPPPPPRCPQQKSIGTFYFIPVQFELLYRHFNRASPISRSEFASAEPRGALLDGWAKLLTETALRRAVLKGDWRQYSDPPFVPLFLTGRYMHLLAEKLSSSVFFILLVSQPVYAAPSDSFFFPGGGWGGGLFYGHGRYYFRITSASCRWDKDCDRPSTYGPRERLSGGC